MNKETLNFNVDKLHIVLLAITEENVGHFICKYENENFKMMTEFILYDKHISLRFYDIESENDKFHTLMEEPHCSLIERKIKNLHFDNDLKININI